MNKVNPLHILLLLVVAVIFLIVQIERTKQELEEEKEMFIQSKELALKTKAYKELYAKKNRQQLQRVLSQALFRNAGIKMQQQKESVIIQASALPLSVLDALMGKIFNGAYKIEKLDIRRVDEKHVALKLEIRW